MKIHGETILTGDLATIWTIVTDVAQWSAWDPHEDAARLDGPFAVGTPGWSKPRGAPAAHWIITAVEPERRWASESPLPGGKITGETTFEAVGDGQVRCRKTVRVSGFLLPVFWLYFGRRIRHDFDATWAALAQEVARRARG